MAASYPDMPRRRCGPRPGDTTPASAACRVAPFVAALCFVLQTALLPSGALAAAPAAKPAAAAAKSGSTADAVQLDAASSEVDYRNNTVNFRDIVITQGAMRVAADNAHATGLNFENSSWVFSGNVRIKTEGGNLRSRQANVEFRNQRISRATILGDPAEFEQQRKGSSELARGHSASIVYDLVGGVVTLTGDAWLSDGRNEIKGRELVYNVKEQRVRAQTQAGDNDRVRITIRPRENGATQPAPPAAPSTQPPKP